MIEDKLLILRLRRGRPQVLREIYDKYKVEMLRLAVVLVGEWNVPAEAAQFTPVIPDDYTPGRPLMQFGRKK